MSLRKIFHKAREFILRRRKDEDRPRIPNTDLSYSPLSWHPPSLNNPDDQHSSSRRDDAIVPVVILTSPPLPHQQLTTAGTTHDVPLHPPSDFVAGQDIIVSETSLQSDRQDYTVLGVSSIPPSPHRPSHDIPQEASTTPTVGGHDIYNAIFREGGFANAHNVSIGTAYMIDNGRDEDERRAEQEKLTRSEQRAEEERRTREEQFSRRERWAKEDREAEEKRQEQEALEKLAAKGMPSAMLESKDRGYVPRCNEDTRQALCDRVIKWGKTDGDIRRLLWLTGPAGVGKSAVAQTVAEKFKAEGLLGGVFFFSRLNKSRLDPDVVIPTLVYQLALLLPEYRRIVTQKLIEDPLILNRNRRSQFEELIVTPFLTFTTHRRLLIVLDGLDKCSDRDAQREFVDMISHQLQKKTGLQFHWVICSRPEADLKVAFSREGYETICLRERLEVEDIEAKKDARRILQRGFIEIRQRYSDQLVQDWPVASQVDLTANRASGHLGFVSSIVRFIGDGEHDPSGQLDACLRFLEGTDDPKHLNPLHDLDLLYTQILSDIPKNILPTTERILGLVLYHGENLSAAIIANFLGLTQASFYRALRHLHSVLVIPSFSEAGKRPIEFYHTSFSDYLRTLVRSRHFALDKGAMDYRVARRSLRWLGHWRENSLDQQALPKVTWIPPDITSWAIHDCLRTFCFALCWKVCPQVPKAYQASLIAALDKFDFGLDYGRWWKEETRGFAYFIRWLVLLGAEYTTLVVIDQRKGDHHSTRVGEITVQHRDDDPCTFVAPFLKGATPADYYTIHIRLGKTNPTPFELCVSRSYGALFSIRR